MDPSLELNDVVAPACRPEGETGQKKKSLCVLGPTAVTATNGDEWPAVAIEAGTGTAPSNETPATPYLANERCPGNLLRPACVRAAI
jgi:hypothetical protein